MKTQKSRRDFLKISAAGGLGAIALTQLGCKNAATPAAAVTTPAAATPAVDPKKFELALQLYTVRDAMEKDVVLALTQVAKAGYTKIELASYAPGKFYGFAPAEFKKICADLGLNPFSSHTQVEAKGITLDNANQMADDHAALGVQYCIQPWVVEEARNIASFQKMVEDLNKVGKIMKDKGIQFGYHNHNFEFATIDGKVPYFDILMPGFDKDLITMELDLFWTIKAGHNPVDLFSKYPGRFQLLHMKDAYTSEAPFFVPKSVDMAPVGAGITDFKSILAARETAGVKHLIVEQDCTFSDIRTSMTNLSTKILA